MPIPITRPAGQIWAANTPPNKDEIVQLMNEVVTGLNLNNSALVPSPNLFDVDSLISNTAIVETTGATIANPNSVATGFIPVQGGQQYRFSTIQRRVWYNSAKAFISGEFVAPGTVPVDRTAPASAAFVRLSFPNNGSVSLSTYMMTSVSAWPEAYIKFGFLPDLANAVLPEERLSAWWKNGYLVAGKNLANEAASTVGSFINSENGVIGPNASLNVTEMIAVEGGAVYSFSGGSSGLFGARVVAQYDVNGALVPTPMFVSPIYETSLTLQSATRFIRVSYHTSAAGQFQVEKAASPTSYEPFAFQPTAEYQGVPINWSARAQDDPQATLHSYGLERLREARTRLMAYRMGLTGRQAQLHMGLIGDSWMMIPAYYARHLSRSIWGRLVGSTGYTSDVGLIGRGYMTLRDDNASGSKSTTRLDAVGAQMTISGAWERLTNNQASASINGQQSTQAGAYVEWPMDYSLTPARSLTLFAKGGAGAVRYRWTSAGSWTSVNLAALPVGLAIVPLTGMPSTGSGDLRIEVVSGTVALFGVHEIASNAPGVVISNLGGSGSTSAQWVAVNRPQFVAAIAATDCDFFEITLGTNDAGAGISQSQFKANIREIVERLRDGRPKADILLSAPAQTTDPGRPIPVSLYAKSMLELSLEMDVAFVDLQPSFGAAAADYTSASDRPYFGDLVHPSQLGALSRAARVIDAIGL